MKIRQALSGFGLVMVSAFSSLAWSAAIINTSCDMVTTSIMPSGDRTNSGNATFSSVIGFDYDVRGYEATATAAHIEVASALEVGTVWGKAYNPNTNKLYVAAFLRRHAPLSPDGLGAIYEIDVSDTTSDATIGAPTLWMDLNSTTHLGASATLFPSETDTNRGLSSPFAPNHDVWGWNNTAKQGIGGLELSDDYSTMYAMDLTNRQLLVINVATKAVTARHAIPNPGCIDGSAEVRPFGVDYLDGDVYVGVTCDEPGDGDTAPFVMRLGAGGSFSNVIASGSIKGYRWTKPWEDDPTAGGCGASNRNHYVPVVTNMELDTNGNMLIGVMSINGWRYASASYAPDASCSSLIGEHSVRGFVVHGTPNGLNWDVASVEEDDNDTYEHHYKDGQFVHWGSGNSHTYKGGMTMAYCSGQEVAIVNLMDPLNNESGGTRWMRTSDAQQEAHEPADDPVTDADKTVSERSTLEHYHGIGDTWEKSAGLGDIEYLRASTLTCSLSSPTISTQCNNAGTPTDPSDDTFTYTINTSGTGIGASYSISDGDTQSGVPYNASYTSPTSFSIAGGNLSLTLTDVDTASCTLTPVTVTTPVTCSSATSQIDVALTKSVSPTSAASGDSVIYTIVATNNGANDATGVVVSDPLPTGVTYSSDDGGANTTELGGTVTWNIGNLASSANATLNITATVD